MKAFLALVVRKSVLEELAFAKISFLDFVNFTTNDRFLKSPSILLSPTLSALADTPRFLSFLVAWMLKAFLLVI